MFFSVFRWFLDGLFCFSGDFLFLAFLFGAFWGIDFIFSRLLEGKSKACDSEVGENGRAQPSLKASGVAYFSG